VKKSVLKQRAKNLPDSPGVYFFKDKKKKVIYIGKAVSLKKRLAHYFQKGFFDPKMGQLIRQIADFDYLPLSSEPEALFLEDRLIKQFQPKYNQISRDDKSYPFLKITKEKFPSFSIVREPKKRTAFYFGPYTDVIALRRAYRYLRTIFPIRRCRKKINPEKKGRVCLDFHLGRCKGPCAGKIKEEEYQKLADALVLFLRGRYRETMRQLKELMKESAEKLNFEEAAKYRDEIKIISKMEGSKVHPHPSPRPQVGRAAIQWMGWGERGRGVSQLKKVLSLPKLPKRIEGVDISDIAGDKAVGSLVVFKDGKEDRAHYRKFKIKGVSGIDDYKMVEEVIARRYQEKKNLPDLLLIDGGKGHLSTVMKKLKEMKLSFPVIALAKRNEEIFLPGSSSPLILKKDSPVLLFLEKIRNEAHRFAISYHQKLRRKALKKSALDKIEGIGEKRKKILLSHFGSLTAIKNASPEELKKLGLSGKLNKRIIKFLDNEK